MNHDTPSIDEVRAEFPSFVRQYIERAGDSGEYYIKAPGCAPVEVRYVRLVGDRTSVIAIVPEVGTFDGGPVWCWGADSERYTIVNSRALDQIRAALRTAAERQAEYDQLEQQQDAFLAGNQESEAKP